MLDQETKRKIDELRNILVGKVPDPKSQVEQVTISLIYKFMNDMDEESMSMGGVASFFVKEYEKYSWKNIFNPRLSGVDLVNLYSEAIEGMSLNPYIPQLFRDIFKNAYIPYRDPETLRLFLKTINDFEYTHSEKLGDAFEYLLSFMGSQGDAGQFRTPRHIIDFVVEIINPQKSDSILDPASGSAGFLISAYKHILQKNTNKTPGDLLTVADRNALSKNLNGYDISPDMVRLGLVNMYLHNFTDPRIYEYDSLTSEDKWSEYYDIILANPPFMTPKGGIRPHQRFGVKSSRAEVLFVDYILEHLKPNGRAGIVVPEGIVKTAQNAFTELRKSLVKNGLVGVVSLPSGVFKPYSGVKTNILVIDKSLSKKIDSIFFIEVSNDGYELGDQRRAIKENDLPEVSSIVKSFLADSTSKYEHSKLVKVSKEEILGNSDASLVLRRYIESEEKNVSYDMYDMSSLYNTISPRVKIKSSEYLPEGDIAVVDQSENFISGFTNDQSAVINLKKPVVIFGDHTRNTKFINFPFAMGADGIKILEAKEDLVLPKFLYYLIKFAPVPSLGYSRHFRELNLLKAPVPDLEDQTKIINELDSYEEIIAGCQKVLNNFSPNLEVSPDWDFLPLGDVASLMTGGTPNSSTQSYYLNGTIPWLVSGDIHNDEIFDCEGRITEAGVQNSNAKLLPINSVLIALNGQGKTRGSVAILRMSATCNQSLVSIASNDESILLNEFIYLYLKGKYQEIRDMTGDKERSGLNMILIRSIQIPVPPISQQLQIIEEFKRIKSLVINNVELDRIYRKKIENKMQSIWSVTADE